MKRFGALLWLSVALPFLAPGADAQVIHYVASAAINFDVRGRDILIDQPTANPITLTLADGGLISCNADPADGLEGVELFRKNELRVTGGSIASEGGVRGGVRLHDAASAYVTGGAVNALIQRDASFSLLQGGTTGTLSLRDRSSSFLFGGSLSLVSVYDSALFEVRGGQLGRTLYLFGGSARFYGTGFRILPAPNPARGGFWRVAYRLTGTLSDGSALDTEVFIRGANRGRRNPGGSLLANDASVPLPTAAAPDAPTGLLLFIGGMVSAALLCGRRLFAPGDDAPDAR